jgi:HEAT repeat protein
VDLLGELLDEAGLDGLGVVVDTLGGAALGPLVPRLQNIGRRVRDARTLAVLAQALGRIGTGQAVDVLASWAAPPGWRIWRRRGAARLAAVDGLRIAAGPEAVRVLEGLSRDADPAVRRAAVEAVEDLSIAAPARDP